MSLLKSTRNFLLDEDYRSLLIATVVCICVGTITYHYLEGWSIIDSFYFSVVTLTTVGYGDFTPQTDAGKLFTIFYIVIGIGIIFAFLNTVFTHYFEVISSTDSNKNNRFGGQNRK